MKMNVQMIKRKSMINFIREHRENIIFVFFIIFFILGVVKNIIFMYISMILLILYFVNLNGKQGLVYIFSLLGLGTIIAFIFDYFGDKGKYFIILFGVFYIIFLLYKRYKSGKSLWYNEEEM